MKKISASLKNIQRYLFTRMIEDRLTAMIKESNSEKINAVIEIRRSLIINIYNAYRWLLEHTNCINDYKNINNDLIKNDDYMNPEKDEQSIAEIESKHPLKNKAVIWEAIEILRSMHQLK